MRSAKAVIGLAILGGLVCGSCIAPVDEADQQEDAVSSVTQPLQNADVVFVRDDAEFGVAGVECPDDHPYMLGGGAFTLESGGIRAIYPYEGFIIPTALGTGMVSDNASASVGAKAVCSEAITYVTEKFDADGEAQANCPMGRVALGGGGSCETGAKLYRSRPAPDTDGSEPTGWKATCTSGAVNAFVICRDKDSVYDFTGCRTQRVDETDGQAFAQCPTGDLLTGAGAYCGGTNQYIKQVHFQSSLVQANATCSGNTVHAYAICCDGLEF